MRSEKRTRLRLLGELIRRGRSSARPGRAPQRARALSNGKVRFAQ